MPSPAGARRARLRGGVLALGRLAYPPGQAATGITPYAAEVTARANRARRMLCDGHAPAEVATALVTTLSVVTFSAAGMVAWPQTLAVLAGALAGGYFGARAARHIPARALRTVIVLTGLGLSLVYFAA